MILGIKSLLHRINLNNLNSFRGPLVDSLKHGLTVFVALLLLLGLLGCIMGMVEGKLTIVFDKLDIATAFVGFILMFAAKLLEKLHGKG